MFAFGRTELLAGTCLLLSDVCVVVRSMRCLQKRFVLKKMCELVLERECVFGWNIIGWNV